MAEDSKTTHADGLVVVLLVVLASMAFALGSTIPSLAHAAMPAGPGKPTPDLGAQRDRLGWELAMAAEGYERDLIIDALRRLERQGYVVAQM